MLIVCASPGSFSSSFWWWWGSGYVLVGADSHDLHVTSMYAVLIRVGSQFLPPLTQWLSLNQQADTGVWLPNTRFTLTLTLSYRYNTWPIHNSCNKPVVFIIFWEWIISCDLLFAYWFIKFGVFVVFWCVFTFFFFKKLGIIFCGRWKFLSLKARSLASTSQLTGTHHVETSRRF